MIDRDMLYFRTFCVVFWVTATFGFISQELVPAITPARHVIFLVCDLAFALLGLACLRGKKQITLFTAFWVIAFVSTILVNHLGWLTFFNGSRDFFGILFVPPVAIYLLQSHHCKRIRQSFDKQLFIFLCLQAVCITEQFISYGANDHGGGTMGFGASGIASMLIILISFYFVKNNWDSDNYLHSLWRNRLYIFLIYPVMLNETKASFVLLAVYFLLLYKPEVKSLGKVLVAAPVIILFFAGLYTAYNAATSNSDENDVASADFINDYLTGADADLEELIDLGQMVQEGKFEGESWEVDIPRFAKIALIPSIVQQSNGGLLLGAGLGQFKGFSVLQPTKFAQNNAWYLDGTRVGLMLFCLQIGIAGLAWFVVYIIFILNFKKRACRMALQLKIFLTFCILFMFFYNDAIRSLVLCIVFFYMNAITACSPTYKKQKAISE